MLAQQDLHHRRAGSRLPPGAESGDLLLGRLAADPAEGLPGLARMPAERGRRGQRDPEGQPDHGGHQGRPAAADQDHALDLAQRAVERDLPVGPRLVPDVEGLPVAEHLGEVQMGIVERRPDLDGSGPDRRRCEKSGDHPVLQEPRRARIHHQIAAGRGECGSDLLGGAGRRIVPVHLAARPGRAARCTSHHRHDRSASGSARPRGRRPTGVPPCHHSHLPHAGPPTRHQVSPHLRAHRAARSEPVARPASRAPHHCTACMNGRVVG